MCLKLNLGLLKLIRGLDSTTTYPYSLNFFFACSFHNYYEEIRERGDEGEELGVWYLTYK